MSIIYRIFRRRRVRRRRRVSRHYQEHKGLARALVHSRIEHFNKVYNFTFNQVRIKNQKTCWGSCSKKGNLNFNYKIALLPEHLADYIIVHELCHLGQLNHSQNFWNLVAQTIPNYRELKYELRSIRIN